MNMADFAEELTEWLETVKTLANLTPKEQAQITKAGAEVFRDALEEETKRKHYSNHKDLKYGHMADNIAVQAKDIDGIANGKSSVGWDNPYHANNARRLNDGTKKYTADHFVTNVQNDNSVQERVLLAEKKEYDKIIKKRGG